jgi:hypothetical protein
MVCFWTLEHIALKPMQFILCWYTGTLSHNIVPQCLLSPTKVILIHGGTLVHCHTTQYLSTHCLQPNTIYIAVVHLYTVTQLCSPVPTVSNQSQFLFMVVHWYIVTHLSTYKHFALKPMQFIVWWYTGTLSHKFVSQCLLSPNKVNLIHGGTQSPIFWTKKSTFSLKLVWS